MTATLDHYQSFLRSKHVRYESTGFHVDPEKLNRHLKDFQRAIVPFTLRKGRAGVFAGCGLGKGQPKGSLILTPHGWKPNDTLKPGDLVIASDGLPYPVTGVFDRGMQPCYRFLYSDKVSAVFDSDHLHIVRTNHDRDRKRPWRVMSTADLVACKNLRYGQNGKSRNYDIPVVAPVSFFANDSLPIDPYIMGVLLGDGHLKGNVMISSLDGQLIKAVQRRLPPGVALKHRNKCDWFIITGSRGSRMHPFRKSIQSLGLLGLLSHEKFIPRSYLFASPSDRLTLLRGLMDTDRYSSKCGCCQFYSTSKALRDGVVHLVRSLGGVPTCSDKRTTLNGKEHKRCFIATFSLATHNPFLLKRKADRWNKAPRDNGRWIDKIEAVEAEHTICLSVDSPDNSYVTENFIVTHNTLMQLVYGYEIHHRNPSAMLLLLCPPAVQWQTHAEAAKFEISAPVKIVREQADCIAGINITNYERLHLFDLTKFICTIPDEASVLKNYVGKTKQALVRGFARTPYRLPCTATPAPNDYKELGNYAEFLGAMPSNEMLARWFINAGDKVGHYRLRKHGAENFWEWLASFCVCISSPSDIGCDDTGYVLPPLNVVEHVVNDGPAPGELFDTGKRVAISATNVHKEKRRHLHERADLVAGLVNADTDGWVVWVDTDYEADAVCDRIPGAIEVRGSQTIEKKESLLRAFSDGKERVIVTKAEIGGFGLNWQHVHKTTWFAGYSYERWYQAICRLLRFGQVHQVDCHLVRTRNEESIVDAVDVKRKAHIEMQKETSGLMREAMMAELGVSGGGGSRPTAYVPTTGMQVPGFIRSKTQ